MRVRSFTWGTGILLLVLIGFFSAPVLAAGEVTLSFSNLNLITRDDIQIYGQDEGTGNWSLLGTFNTSSEGIVLDGGNYMFVVKPKSTDLIRTPMDLLDGVAEFTRTNLVALLIGAFILGIALWRR